MRLGLLSIILFLCVVASAQFIPNKGQWQSNVLFKSDIPGGVLFFEESKLTYNLMHPDDAKKVHGHAHRIDSTQKSFRFHSFQMSFINASTHSLKSGVNPLAEKINYFQGNDKSRWVSNISPCEKVKYTEVYKGIDAIFYTEAERPKYDFIVHAGAEISDIQLKFDGADRVYVNNNELKVKLSFTEIIEQIPIAYQSIKGRKVSVPCYFVVRNNVVSFKVGEDYDKNYDLVIDPVMIFSTFSGSVADNFGYTATYDDEGFLYAGGTVFDIGYITTPGAYQKTFNSDVSGIPNGCFGDPNLPCWGVSDIAITKYDTTGTKRIYSTYIGGNQCEVPHSLVVNSKGELIIYGTTGSSNYPVTSNAIDQSFGGGAKFSLAYGIYVNYIHGSDIIISKLNVDGTQLLASTYYGGSGNDGLNLFLDYNYADQMRGDVEVDKQDNIFIASCTFSKDIAGVNGFQTSNNGVSNGLIAKFNSDLSSVYWASYLGGSKFDAAYSMVLDEKEDLVVAGGATSNNLPTTAGVLFPVYQGASADGFIGKISNDGKTLNALTYFGTASYDQVYIVQMDKNQNIYVYGQSESMDGTLVKNALYSSVNSGVFVSKLANDLKSIIWSTTFGSGDGKINLSPTAFMVDLCNKVYLTGWGSPNGGFEGLANYLVDPSGNTGYNGARGTAGLTVTPDAFQSTTDGSDFYIMVLEADASAISYASFFGGNQTEEHVDGGTSRFDKKGKIYQSICAGCGHHSEMYTSPNAVSKINGSECNNAVFKMDFLLANVIADFKAVSVCPSQNLPFNNTSLIQKNTSYYWDFGDGSTSTLFEPSHVFKSAGTYSVKLVLTDPGTCNFSDTVIKSITVNPFIGFLKATSDVDTILKGNSTLLHVVPTNLPVVWSPSATLNDAALFNPLASPITTTTYQVSLKTNSQNTCVSGDSVSVFIYEPKCAKGNVFVPNVFTPNGDGKNDVLYVRGNNITELYFTIYDRWGEPVFETKDQSVGWKGDYKTQSSDPAVFAYYLKVKCGDGKDYFEKGNITVIR